MLLSAVLLMIALDNMIPTDINVNQITAFEVNLLDSEEFERVE